MRDYVHRATVGALAEFLPLADNRVTLAELTDRHGFRSPALTTTSETTTRR